MKLRAWPIGTKVTSWTPTVKAHSRGAESGAGHYAYERAPGASWIASLAIAAMKTSDALKFRGFLHSLRGRSGTFFYALPGMAIPAARNVCTLAGGLTTYTDCAGYSDGTTYADGYTGVAALLVGTSSGALAAGASTVTTAGIDTARLVPGEWLRIGDDPATMQLVRIVSAAGAVATFRPRLRNAFSSGAPVSLGRVEGLFRLAEQTPAVPLVNNRSASVSLNIEEAY